MKKIYALILATVMLFSISAPVFANNVISPINTPSASEEEDKSAETGDMNLLYVGIAGVALAGAAVVVAVKSKKIEG